MDIWRLWYRMALDSQRAAHQLEKENLRSCASRIYYAAYQAVTAVLLYRRLPTPPDREGWSHEATPDMIIEHWSPYISRKYERRDLARRLRRLYTLRLIADYTSTQIIDAPSVRSAMKDGDFLITVVRDILPGE